MNMYLGQKYWSILPSCLRIETWMRTVLTHKSSPDLCNLFPLLQYTAGIKWYRKFKIEITLQLQTFFFSLQYCQSSNISIKNCVVLLSHPEK